MFMCKQVVAEHMVSSFGEQWKTIEGEHKNSIFNCNVIESKVTFRYVKAGMTLYILYSYKHWKKKKNYWVPLQAKVQVVLPLQICITLPNGAVEIVSAHSGASLMLESISTL